MKRIIHLSAGIILVALGIVITPLPIPLGLVMLVLGLSLLVSVVPALRGYLVRIRRQYPVTSLKLRHLNHRLPRFLQSLLTDTDPDNPLNQTTP